MITIPRDGSYAPPQLPKEKRKEIALAVFKAYMAQHPGIVAEEVAKARQ